ncbi:hypothetical protein H0H93_002641, partial [Arthromyces matolae]
MGRNRKGKKKPQTAEAAVEVLGVLVDPRLAFVSRVPLSTTYDDLKLLAKKHIETLYADFLVEGEEPPIPSAIQLFS